MNPHPSLTGMKRKPEDLRYVSFLSTWQPSPTFERFNNFFSIEQSLLTHGFDNFVKAELQNGGTLELKQFTFGSFFNGLEQQIQINEEKYAFKGRICLYLMNKNNPPNRREVFLDWQNSHALRVNGNYILNERSDTKEDSPHIIPVARADKSYELEKAIYIELKDGKVKFHHRASVFDFDDLQIHFRYLRAKSWPDPFLKYKKMSCILPVMQSLKTVLVYDVLQIIATFIRMLIHRPKMFGFWKANLKKLFEGEYRRHYWKKPE